MSDVTIVILGAGAGRRMRGGDKLLEPVDGAPLLRVLAKRALATGHKLIVTLPPDDPARRDALIGLLDVRIVPVQDADTGMSASFRALADQQTDLLVCLGDMPDVQTSHMEALIAARADGRPVRATTADGTPGQPVLFPRDMVARFVTLTGDSGARLLLSEVATIHVPLPGTVATTDLDTPEAWAQWRKQSQSQV